MKPEAFVKNSADSRSQNSIGTDSGVSAQCHPTGIESNAQLGTRAAKKGIRFWCILFAVGFCGLLISLEATVTSTALPTIIADLGGGDLFVWAINAFALTTQVITLAWLQNMPAKNNYRTALQPMFGQLANIYGRRWPIIGSTAAFTLGSGICGGATSMAMFIAGRAVQGIGAGGTSVLIHVIICDLVPLRERGRYFAIILGLVAAGTALGPLFGGLIVDHTTWRWIFYLNLPVGGFALLLLIIFLKVQGVDKTAPNMRITRIDWIGNVIFGGAVSAILIALSRAGTTYPWSSCMVIIPLAIGFASLAGLMFFEKSRFVSQPAIPLHLFSNRTSATAFSLTFIHSLVAVGTVYFLPLYFQGVLGSSPSRSGVQLLPTILTIILFAGIGGVTMSKLGRYRPIHYVGYAIILLGFGLFTLLDEKSSIVAWVGFQMIESAGVGLIISTLLPAVTAPLAESDTALAAATWTFIRNFGLIWGLTIPAAIFSNRFNQLAATRITDPVIRAVLNGGFAYEHATPAFPKLLPEATREQVVWVLNESLRRIWQVTIGFAALGFLLVSFEREVPLRQELETEFGLR
jgi:MFS family permease